ncbi:MAG: hypothetical protein ACYSSN_02970 [Planctomycetota bacterium]
MVCWLFRLMISHTADNDNQPSDIIQEHMSNCVDCSQFYKTCQSLGERLTREALISNSRTSRRLNDHILEAIPSRPTETHKVRMKLWTVAAAACVALIILIGASLMVIKPIARNNIHPKPAQMSVAIQELRSVYRQVGKDLPISWPQVIEEPLANEFENLTNDTESAVRFLVACVAVDIVDVKGGPLN